MVQEQSNQDAYMSVDEAYNQFFVNIEKDSLADISHLGRWRLSSSKGEFGLRNLLDHEPSTYWQSDGDLPHTVEVQFSKLVEISMIGLFTDFSMDESYTPQRIHVYAGFGCHNLVRVHTYELNEAEGWSCMFFDQQGPSQDRPLQCTFIRLEIAKNFQNGKDTHLRGMRIVGPRRQRDTEGSPLELAFRRL